MAKPKRGSFEKAMPEGYEPTACWLYGPFAIHETGPFDRVAGRYAISHAATGLLLPGAYASTVSGAATVCNGIIDLIDWSKIERGKRIMTPRGFSKREARAKLPPVLMKLSIAATHR